MTKPHIDISKNHKYSRSNWILPQYDNYCFSRLPLSITGLFGLNDLEAGLPITVWGQPIRNNFNKVVLFFIDAFGWKFFTEFSDDFPALQRFTEHGTCNKLTAQFPSTTSAHVTTIMTGVPVYKSGIFEWFYYEPKVGNIISPLLFCNLGQYKRDELIKSGFEVAQIYPPDSIFSNLKQAGIKSCLHQSNTIIHSSVTNYLGRDAQLIGFKQVQHGLQDLALKLQTPEAAYHYFYFDKIDSTLHDYGPESKEFKNWCNHFFTCLEQDFFQVVEGKVKDCMVILVADHGQIAVQPEKTIYLDKELPELSEHIILSEVNGQPLVPAGSARDLFLYIKDNSVQLVKEQLLNILGEKADVLTKDEMLAVGLFSENPSHYLLERLSNLLILPRQGNTVWWSGNGRFKMDLLGHHGGLSPEEIEIPLLSLRL